VGEQPLDFLPLSPKKAWPPWAPVQRAAGSAGENLGRGAERRVAQHRQILAMAPLVARGADLVMWWEEGLYPGENEAVAEIIARPS
jgi:hypothetical protein